ncbi:MAG TPA: hypothetical protein VMK12_05975 [Anaeromyxobacteraceae bacterium]|nr:hypothetical protein [Anaeromyxobacteraceae bacterium]
MPRSSLPTNGQNNAHDKFSGETMRETILARSAKPKHGYHAGCVIQCSQVCLLQGWQVPLLGLRLWPARASLLPRSSPLGKRPRTAEEAVAAVRGAPSGHGIC